MGKPVHILAIKEHLCKFTSVTAVVKQNDKVYGPHVIMVLSSKVLYCLWFMMCILVCCYMTAQGRHGKPQTMYAPLGIASCGVLCTLLLLPFFLVLLDYVSRAYEIKICPSSFRPSVRVAIISEANARMSFKFWFLFQLGHTLGHVLNFWKTNDFFSNIFCFR